jgi:hypothetical protein
MIFCGPAQSSVWLNIPPGFTTDWGGSFYCDPTTDFPDKHSAWNQTGYLVGYWISLLKPFTIVFEIDPTRLDGTLCSDCVEGRYYVPGRGWLPLPSHVDNANLRVSVTISKDLHQSGYAGYEDRYLVALFERTTLEMHTPSPTPIKASTPSPTLTQVSTPTATLTPTATYKPTDVPTSVVTSTTDPESEPWEEVFETPAPPTLRDEDTLPLSSGEKNLFGLSVSTTTLALIGGIIFGATIATFIAILVKRKVLK